MSSTISLLQWGIYFLRYGGPLVILGIAMLNLISSAAQSKLSPTKMAVVFGSALFAAFLFWVLPAAITDVGKTANSVAPYVPSSGYGR
ncbi:hypothetical protein [Nocardia sp. CDC160]|uniref:hypothetical protein n=1 Tax=Nocardia sp. CDC160 TaxID=3112166 RepID=UPI002DB639BC|nr:hypothetical protein [Nocardia sp. CDC160]MEC3920668.1 hypothetical protein [Nocardia sp. CDC160]